MPACTYTMKTTPGLTFTKQESQSPPEPTSVLPHIMQHLVHAVCSFAYHVLHFNTAASTADVSQHPSASPAVASQLAAGPSVTSCFNSACSCTTQ